MAASSSLAGSRNSTGSSSSSSSALLKNYFSMQLDHPFDPVVTQNLDLFDQVKKGDYIKVVGPNCFHLYITRVESMNADIVSTLSQFHLRPTLSETAYMIEIIQGRKCKVITAFKAKLSDISSATLKLGEMVGLTYERKPIEAAVIDLHYGGASTFKPKKSSLTVEPIQGGFKVTEYNDEGKRVTVLKEVQWVTLYPAEEMPPVVKRYFAIVIPSLYQMVLSDQLKELGALQIGDRLKVICDRPPVYFDIEEVSEVPKPDTLGLLQIEVAKEGFHSIEVCDGQTLRTFTTTIVKVLELDLGERILGTHYPYQGEFDVVEKGQGITFIESIHKIHAVVVGYKFGVGVQSPGERGFTIKKFLEGYEIHLDDSRGQSVISLENVPLLCTILI